MKIIAITNTSKIMQYCIIEDNIIKEFKTIPTVVKGEFIGYHKLNEVITSILNHYKPDTVALRMFSKPQKTSIFNCVFVQGNIALNCESKNIKVEYWMPQSYVKSRYKIDKTPQEVFKDYLPNEKENNQSVHTLITALLSQNK